MVSSEEMNALIVVAKQPAPGRTKTRLSPPLQLDQASSLYECFLSDTLDQMRRVLGVQRVIAYLPLEAEGHFRQLAPDFQLTPQIGDDLGVRLDNALTLFLSRGCEHVVIMDSDSPTLPPSYLSQAFNVLADGVDVTVGPCEDGGYYLIGVNRPVPRLLREVRMSTPSVTADTIAIAKEEGLRVGMLPFWYDVDDAASLTRLLKEVDGLGPETAAHTRRFLKENEIQRLIEVED